MSDFADKVVWQGYKLGALGVLVYRYDSKEQRYRKHFVPLVFIVSMEEEATDYSSMLDVTVKALLLEFAKQSKTPPVPIFCQFHSDFSKASSRAIKDKCPHVHHVNDLEHLERALTDHQTRGDVNARFPDKIGIVIAAFYLTAYIFNAAAFHLYWKTTLRHWEIKYDAAGFVKYFKKRIFEMHPIGGRARISEGFVVVWTLITR